MMVVLVTCGDRAEARRIAWRLVEERLAACVNIFPAAVWSIYRWKGKVETAREFLLVIKTSWELFEDLRRRISRLHRYEVPEIIALPIAAGAASYLRWLDESLGRPAPSKGRSTA